MELTINDIIGKHIIIGLTYVDYEGNIVNRIQLHGDITNINDEYIFIRLNDGSEFTLPPDITAIEIAPPGEYEFSSTGEVIVNPDLMTTWTIHQPKPKNTNIKK